MHRDRILLTLVSLGTSSPIRSLNLSLRGGATDAGEGDRWCPEPESVCDAAAERLGWWKQSRKEGDLDWGDGIEVFMKGEEILW